MQIVAKFSSTCSLCQKPIAVGAKIEWEKGKPSRHVTCPTGQAPATIVIEPHPDRPETKFVKCTDCGASAIQGATGQAGILRHRNDCDTKATPTAEQLSGKPTPPPTAPAVAEVPGAKTYPLYSYRGWGKPERDDDVGKSVRAGKQAHADIAGQIVTILTQRNTYQSQSDAEDMGDGRGGWTSTYTVRLATEAEAAPVLVKEAIKQKEADRKKNVAQYQAELSAWARSESLVWAAKEGLTWPVGATYGKDRYDSSYWVVDADLHVWHLRYNGRDGDDWQYNNLDSMIVTVCKDPVACEKIRALLEVVYGKA